MYSYDEVYEKILDENIIGGVEDMFYDFDSEKALAIWNKYCDTKAGDYHTKVYHNDIEFFVNIEMKEKGLTAVEILERIKKSGSNYNPAHRYITITNRCGCGEDEFYCYWTHDNATDLMDADPDFAVYLIGLYATRYSDGWGEENE